MADSELQVAKDAARAGGEIIMRYFRAGADVRVKQGEQSYNLVSDADVESEQAVVETIRRAFPQDEVLAEESHPGDAAAQRLWVVDPLDGTNNFAHGIPHFTVSIAHYRDGKPHCGVIFNPVSDDWFIAQRGGGATHNGRRVQVSAQSRLEEILVGVGFYYDRGRMMEATLDAIRGLFTRQIHGIRRFGTASLDLCHVGMGKFGAYFEYELSPWDFAAGRLFVEEAGGKVTDCQGGELPLANSSVLATNGLVHDKVLEVVKWAPPHTPA